MLMVLDRCLDYPGRVIAGISDDQRDEPTPCADFNVEQLTAHLLQGLRWYAGVPAGGSPDPTAQADPDLRGRPLDAAYDEAAAAVRKAWTADQLPAVFDTPMGPVTGEGLTQFMIVELLGHGWDLATATGQPTDPGTDLAEAGLRVAHGLGQVLRSPGMMGSAVPVPADAPAADRLVAYLGRRPRP